jgi:hypothetical protein
MYFSVLRSGLLEAVTLLTAPVYLYPTCRAIASDTLYALINRRYSHNKITDPAVHKVILILCGLHT